MTLNKSPPKTTGEKYNPRKLFGVTENKKSMQQGASGSGQIEMICDFHEVQGISCFNPPSVKAPLFPANNSLKLLNNTPIENDA